MHDSQYIPSIMTSPNDSINEQSSQTSTDSSSSFVQDMRRRLGSSAYGSAIIDFGNNVSILAEESYHDIINQVDGISASDVVQNIRGRIQSFTSGDQQGREDTPEQDTRPDAEEIERIDNMDRERIVEYLQERHKSTAQRPTTN